MDTSTQQSTRGLDTAIRRWHGPSATHRRSQLCRPSAADSCARCLDQAYQVAAPTSMSAPPAAAFGGAASLPPDSFSASVHYVLSRRTVVVVGA